MGKLPGSQVSSPRYGNIYTYIVYIYPCVTFCHIISDNFNVCLLCVVCSVVLKPALLIAQMAFAYTHLTNLCWALECLLIAHPAVRCFGARFAVQVLSEATDMGNWVETSQGLSIATGGSYADFRLTLACLLRTQSQVLTSVSLLS